mmetsp:Transcript_57782/g.176022  ORF Transcript_57782/g.176022 Transcript_57782/m.176022 type:complete len:224 (-) Transcript_57782:230-901(-)
MRSHVTRPSGAVSATQKTSPGWRNQPVRLAPSCGAARSARGCPSSGAYDHFASPSSSSCNAAASTDWAISLALSFAIRRGAAHRVTEPSVDEVTICRPGFPKKHRSVIHDSCARKSILQSTSWPWSHMLRTSQTRIVQSDEPEASKHPSGENATARTLCLCPTILKFPVILQCSPLPSVSGWNCHTQTAPSSLPQAHQLSMVVCWATQSTPLPLPPGNLPSAR